MSLSESSLPKWPQESDEPSTISNVSVLSWSVTRCVQLTVSARLAERLGNGAGAAIDDRVAFPMLDLHAARLIVGKDCGS